MAKKNKQGKAAKIITRLLSEILSGKTTYAQSLEQLDRLGFKTDSAFEDQLLHLHDAIESLTETPTGLDPLLAEIQPEVFCATVDLLAFRRDLDTLLHLRGKFLEKEKQKAIGAAIYKLEAAGMDIPRFSPPSKVTSSREKPQAFVDVRSELGEMAAVLLLPGEPSTQFFLIVLDETRGFNDISMEERGARALWREWQQSMRDTAYRTHACEISHFMFLVQEGIAQSRAQHRFVPLEISTMMHRLEDLGYTARQWTPEDASALTPLCGTLAQQQLQLAQQPEVLSWPVNEALLTSVLTKLGESASSPLIVGEELEREKIRGIFVEGATELFTEEKRKHFSRRLEDLAHYYDASSQPALRDEAWCSALALKDTSIPISDIPFASQYVEIQAWLVVRQFQPEFEGHGPSDAATLEPQTAGPQTTGPRANDNTGLIITP